MTRSSAVHLHLLLFYSDAVGKVRFMWRTITSIPDHWHQGQMTRCRNFGTYFTTEEDLIWHQVICEHQRPHNQIDLEVVNLEADRFLPRHQIERIKHFFFSIPPSLSDHSFPNSYTKKLFIILLPIFPLLWPGKVTIHITQATAKEDKQTIGFALMLVIM